MLAGLGEEEGMSKREGVTRRGFVATASVKIADLVSL
jgi:hypothetical protein